jgi:aminopeptidase
MSADKNADTLQRLLDTDDGARRLGEVALVPHSSPISQSGLLYYNTLFDENAASHVALGNAYKFTLKGGNEMSDAEFAPAGGTPSGVPVDFWIGSG